MEYGGEHMGGKTGEEAWGNGSLKQQWACRHQSSKDGNALVSSALLLSAPPVFLVLGFRFLKPVVNI